ncbi:phosphotransferase [Paenibacillus sp. RC67]|uniref:phosphotransferase n=1 Tax=Paenibacillus sp. RC67 TaxID=3039392 RepID=UPI0024ADFC75|nr:phosphotransferase [Paenibacillus sp. RC67]
MGKNNSREAATLLTRFKVKAKRIDYVQKGVYRVVLINGSMYCLKRMPCPVTRLHWIDRALLRVKKTGFPRMAWRKPLTREGKRLFVRAHSRTNYILTPWIQGRWPDPRSSKDMRACGIALAKFHSAGRNVDLFKAGSSNMLGSWPRMLGIQHIFLKKHVTTAHKNGFHRQMDHLLKQHGHEILGYSKAASRGLLNSKYKAICSGSRNRATLCHGDGGPTNFIINSTGTHLIDFETLRFDLRAYELYRVLYNSCKDHSWNFAIARSILDGYQSVNKLNKEDFALLKVWLRFPQTTYLLLRKFNHRSLKDKTTSEKEFLRALKDERRITLFLKHLDKYAR